jgi:hypothetical protein
MTHLALTYGSECDRQNPPALQPDVQVNPVSVVSAGIAYQDVHTPADLVAALIAGRPMWNRQQHLLRFEQLRDAAALETREARKLDRFSLLALAAARGAVNASRIGQRSLSTCGIYSGNMVGGWTFTEPQVRNLHGEGLGAVSPYLATAWFPGASQGQISIHLKMTGFAKTVTTDRCSGAQAVGLAYERIRVGLQPTLLLAGGAEAPVTPFVGASLTQIPAGRVPAVEAAAYLMLSAGATGEVQIKAHRTCAVDLRSADLADNICKWVADLMDQPGVSAPGFVLCNVPCLPRLEGPLSAAIRTALGRQVDLWFPTNVLGETLAASGALACVAAAELLTIHARPCSSLVLSLGHHCCDLLLLSGQGGQIS